MIDSDFVDLLARAWRGDETAWAALVRGLSAVILGVARSHRLGDADASDVCQNTWAALAQRRELRDPARLPGWLATTARRHALRVLEMRRHEVPVERDRPDRGPAPERVLLIAERDAVLRQGVAALPGHQQRLAELLLRDPPATHAEIAAELGIAVGSVGPLRRRALDRLRRYLEARGYDHP
ncbi:RNA polymerase sigma factor [Amycolatopsis granulosa]|uniref:RNA polymerase sigma factor n=1 Tax=Amycolatopsis granulosa TaxID=185684 RepID=UPI00142366FF|nr:sigma-70 family RNA polymerase sigma factor [Amycolatopsis granulosa]NIH85931.1 RNA polymerase sigma factor (sigma-70 family) [Amycolatopsis granulosa]